MSKKITLNEHLRNLNQNSRAGAYEISKLRIKIANKFLLCGYEKAAKDVDLIDQYINMIFKTQDYRCAFWLKTKKGELNGLWNAPHRAYTGWKSDTIWYEIDHVNPKNNGGVDHLENYQFLSANANRFTKCSLTIPDLLRRVDLSDRLKHRIIEVTNRRKELFKSKKWKMFMKKMKEKK